MGSHLLIERDGGRVHIDANVGLIPLVVQYMLLMVGIFVWRKWRRK